MAAVTQRIPNFLGGISQQADTLKRPNQLRRCVNAFPDTTFGLIKRSGGQFVSELKNTSNAIIAPPSLDTAKWFTIFRDGAEKYVGAISSGAINIWDIQTGAPKSVSITGSGSSYLSGANLSNIHILSINDFTYVTNRSVTVSQLTPPAGGWPDNKAFISLKAIAYNANYRVTVAGVGSALYTTPSAGVLSVDTVLQGISTQIQLSIGGVSPVIVGSGIYLVTDSGAPFRVTVAGGTTGDALEVFQQSVPNISKLPTQCVANYVVKVANISGEEDDYYVKFVPDSGSSGTGIWEETIRPGVSLGLNPATMPHQLVRQAGGNFTFGPVTYESRLIGDDTSNAMPSFVGNKIRQMFFYRNRLGVLTEDNVILSQAGDYFNFFGQSALTTVDSDPIDVTTSSTKPASLCSVTPVAQGLVLFGRAEQFLLTASNDTLSPGSVVVKSISRYEFDPALDPADLGVTTAFITKSPSYTRVFEMETLSEDSSPFVNDISKSIPELLPSTIDTMSGSGQSSLLALSGRSSRDAYLFQFLSDGQRRIKESWFQWTLSGNVIHHAIENDVFWVVTKQASSYVIQKLDLIQSPDVSVLRTTDGSRVDPRLDMWKAGATKVLSGSDTKVYLPYINDSNRQLRVVIANSSISGPDYSNSGAVFTPTTIAQDGGGWYALIPNRDLTAENLIVGYTYHYEVELPRIYFRSGEEQSISDFTAYLTVARIKFNFGLTGELKLRVVANGREDWDLDVGVKKLNYYKLNDIPFTAEGVFTLPIHQRSENFRVSVLSDSPFPVSLISAMWEGNYSPRFYRRS